MRTSNVVKQNKIHNFTSDGWNIHRQRHSFNVPSVNVYVKNANVKNKKRNNNNNNANKRWRSNKHKQLLEIDLIYRINCPVYKNMNLMLSYAILIARCCDKTQQWIETKWMSDVSFLFWSLFCFGLLLRAAQNDSYLGLLAFNDFCLVCLAAFLSLFRLCHSVIRREYNSKWSTDESTQRLDISHAFYTSLNGVLGDFVNLLPAPTKRQSNPSGLIKLHAQTYPSMRINIIAIWADFFKPRITTLILRDRRNGKSISIVLLSFLLVYFFVSDLTAVSFPLTSQ